MSKIILDSKNKNNNNLIKIFLYVKQFKWYNQPLRKVWKSHIYKKKGTTFFQCNKVLSNRFKKYAHWKWYTMNRNSFIWLISYTIKWMYKYSKKNFQKKNNVNPSYSAQQSFFKDVL